MIYLSSVSKAVTSKHEGPKLVFNSVSITVPTDRRVAILADRQQGKTLLLRLLAGVEAPDEGEIFTSLTLSPIANARTLFHPRLSGTENIRLVARMVGVDAHSLITAVDAICHVGAMAEQPIATLSGPQRQILEIAVLSVLHFDCYLLDNSHAMPVSLLERFFDAAERRKAGMVFTTVLPRHVYEYADFAIVIRGCTARSFNQVEEAIESYERQSA
jgi:capsular polysaccharide transport system ATP-binding protein